MTGWNPQLARLRQQLAQVLLTPGADLAERSAAALEALGRVLPADAAWLAVRDPEARRHTPLATAGAAEPLRSYFQTRWPTPRSTPSASTGTGPGSSPAGDARPSRRVPTVLVAAWEAVMVQQSSSPASAPGAGGPP